jgi:hypothetical protein
MSTKLRLNVHNFKHNQQTLVSIYGGGQVKKKRKVPKVKDCQLGNGPVVINLAYCSNGSRDIMRAIIKKYGWIETTEHVCHILWTDQKFASSCESFRMVEKRQAMKTNYFPDCREAVSKAFLLDALGEMKRLYPEEYDFYPKSWDISNGVRAFEKAIQEGHENKSKIKTYIVKPSMGKQGDGIHLFQQFHELLDIAATHETDKLTIQEYIDNPMLLDGFKFDFRIYVLVESLQPLRVCVFRDGLARFCAEKYCVPKERNMADPFIHLTNYSLNKNHVDFKEADEDGYERIIYLQLVMVVLILFFFFILLF